MNGNDRIEFKGKEEAEREARLKDIKGIEEEKSYLKSLFVSAIFGLVFGGAVLIYILVKEKGEVGLFYYGLPIYCGLLSGLAGLTGNYLQVKLMQRGVKSKVIRSVISFAVVMVISLSITYFGFAQQADNNFLQEMRSRMVWGVGFGGIFGLIITVVEYYQWKVKQRMLVLELENKYLEELAARDLMLKEATKNMLVAGERNRMARELHDSVSQGIHGIVYSVGSLKQLLSREEINKSKVLQVIDHLEKTADNTLEELRSMIKELKPALLEKNSLTAAISAHCDLFASRQGIRVEQDLEEIEFMSPEQELAVFRIVQEALANIQKHSGADRVLVALQAGGEAKEAFLLVKDNGTGFDREEITAGNGLNNMEIRSRQAGGEFQLQSTPGKGTEIKVVINKK